MCASNSRLFTSEQVNSQMNMMWDAVAKTIELDRIVNVGELCDYVYNRITCNPRYSEVYKCIISEYVSARLGIE